MAAGDVQLKFNLSLGSTSYEDKIRQMTLRTQRGRAEIPATGGNLQRSAAPTDLYQELIIDFFSSHAAASVWRELYDTIITDAGEIAFAGTPNDAAAGADNPEWSGTARIFNLDSGGIVTQLRQQQITLVVTEAGVTEDVGA